MKNVVFVAVAIGLMLGAFGAVLLARLLGSVANRHLRLSLQRARLGAIVGGSLALVPAFFVAIAVGGSLGADFFPGDVGLLIGAIGGIAVLFGLGLAGGIVAGVLVFALATRLVGGANAP